MQPWRPLWLWRALPLVFALWFKLTSTANGLETNRDIFMHIWQRSHFGQPVSRALIWGGESSLFCSLCWPELLRALCKKKKLPKKKMGGKKKKKGGEGQRKKEEKEPGKTGGGSFTYHNSLNSEMHLVLFEDLIIHPAARQHSSTRADKGKSLLQPQMHHIEKNRLNLLQLQARSKQI